MGTASLGWPRWVSPGGYVAALVGDLAQNSHEIPTTPGAGGGCPHGVLAASRWSAAVSNRPHRRALSRGRHTWPGAAWLSWERDERRAL